MQREAKEERHGAMVCTHVSRKKTRDGLHGRLRQKRKDGYFHYRLTITNGTRKEFTLRTTNYDEAVQKASELDSIWVAPTQEVALAQMNAIRGFSTQTQKITFEEAWERYQIHPDRAIPSTVEGRLSYRKSFDLFTQFATGQTGKVSSNRAVVNYVNEVTTRLREEFAAFLRTQMLSVYTHNRRMREPVV